MLYNRKAVEKKVPVTKEQLSLARKHNLCKLGNDFREEIRDTFEAVGYRGLKKIKVISFANAFSMEYDEKHKFEGIRNNRQTWKDGKGHCIELAINLKAVLNSFDVKTSWSVQKNPFGLEGDGLLGVGIHPFIVFEKGGAKYQVEANTGRVLEIKNPLECLAKINMDAREFTAFCIHDGGEDLGLIHGKHNKSLEMLDLASRINPNDYTIYCTAGTVNFLKRDHDEAERCFNHAISLAPSLMDPHKAYGDYLFDTYVSPEFAIREYRKASKKTTEDLQILSNLEMRLHLIGERKLSEKIKSRKEKIMGKRKFRYLKYLY